MPIIEYKNNKEGFGDFEQQITLIDAYNTLMSDRVNDKDQFIDALLILYARTEAEKLAKMNAEQKAQYEREKKDQELAKREVELTARELKVTAKETLGSKGLPTSLADVT